MVNLTSVVLVNVYKSNLPKNMTYLY